jgi:hypothetical protein
MSVVVENSPNLVFRRAANLVCGSDAESAICFRSADDSFHDKATEAVSTSAAVPNNDQRLISLPGYECP